MLNLKYNGQQGLLMEKKVALGSLTMFGVFLIGAIIVEHGGVQTTIGSNSMTGFVIAQGEERPLSLATIFVIVLFLTNLLTLFLFVREKTKHIKDL